MFVARTDPDAPRHRGLTYFLMDMEQDGVEVRPLVQVYAEAQVLRLNAYRGLTATMKRGAPGPEGSLGKWHWAEVNQSLTELGMDVEGSLAADGVWTHRFLRARANSIEGGTTEILKNIVAERVLGLP